jgi:hypothetical protein
LDTTYGSTSGGGEKQKGKKFWWFYDRPPILLDVLWATKGVSKEKAESSNQLRKLQEHSIRPIHSFLHASISSQNLHSFSITIHKSTS